MLDFNIPEKIIFNWKCLELTGQDVEIFLNRQTTNDVREIKDHGFQFNCLTDNLGRIVSWFLLYKIENNYLMFIPLKTFEDTRARLEKYLISEDVELHEKNSLLHVIFNKTYPDYFWGEKAKVEIIKNSSQDLHSEEKEYQDLRLRNGFLYLKDELPENEIINNTTFINYVSFTKGCYPGQETVNKIFNNRGASKFPVAIELLNEIQIKDHNFLGQFKFLDKRFLIINLKREDLLYNTKYNTESFEGIIRELPLLSYQLNRKIDILMEYAQEYFLNNSEHQALDVYEYALSHDPQNEELLERAGVLLGRQNKFNEAIELMKRILMVNNLSSMAHTNLSLFYMKIGNIEEAEKHKDQAVLKSFQYHAQKAKNEKIEKETQDKKINELNQRRRMFEEVLSIDADDSFALLGICEITFELNEFELFKKFYEKLISLEPENYKLIFIYAKYLKQMNDQEGSKIEILKSRKFAAKKGDQKFLKDHDFFFRE